jgi:hypothetical protein
MKVKMTAAFLAFVLTASSTLVFPSPVRAEAMFTPQTLKKAMLDFYCQFPGQPAEAGCKEGTPGAGLPAQLKDMSVMLDTRPAPERMTNPGELIWGRTTADQKIWALELFDQILALDPDHFNETLKDLSDDYYAYPEHRAGIELLLSMVDVQRSAGVNGIDDHTADAVRERLREELYGRRHESKFTQILTRAFRVLLVATLVRGAVVGPYKGFKVWRSGGLGLSRLEQTKEVLRATIEGFKINEPGVGFKGNIKALARGEFKSVLLAFVKDKRIQLMAAGTTWALVDMVRDSFRTFKMDPHHVLEPVQAQILEDAGREAAYQRDEIRAMLQENDAELGPHSQAYRERLLSIEKSVTKVTRELGHLYEVAAQYRPIMEPIAQDLTEVRQKSKELLTRLNKLEVMENLKGTLR